MSGVPKPNPQDAPVWRGAIPENYLTESGAVDLAYRLKAYWEGRGYRIEAWAEKIQDVPTDRHRQFEVRSNLVAGLPRDYRG